MNTLYSNVIITYLRVRPLTSLNCIRSDILSAGQIIMKIFGKYSVDISKLAAKYGYMQSMLLNLV